MRRIWIHFTERQAAAIEASARHLDIPMSEVVRRGMTQYLDLEPERVEMGRPYKSPELAPPDPAASS